MFCENCGNKVDEGMKFCTTCGARVEDSASEQDVQQPEVSDVAVTEQPVATVAPASEFVVIPEIKKKSRKPIALIVAAVILLFVITAAASPAVRNSVIKTVMSPEDYFKYVVKNSFDDSSEDAAKMVGTLTDSLSMNQAAEGSVKLVAGDGLVELLEDFGAEDVDEYIEWFKSAGINYDVNVKDGKTSVNYAASLNDTKIVSLDVVADTDNGEFYIGIPELNSTYLSTSVDSLELDEEIFAGLEEIYNIIPDEKLLQELIYKYLCCVVEGVNDVDKSNDTVDAGGVSQRLTVLKVNLDSETVINICTSFLKEVKEDKDIEKLIKDFAESKLVDADGDDVYDNVIDAIDETIDDIEDTEDELDELLEDADFRFYITGKGEVAGFAVEVDNFNAELVTTEKGSKFGALCKIESYNSDFIIEGSGKKSGKKHSGDFIVEVEGLEVINASVKDVNTEKLKEGIFAGELSIELGDDLNNFISGSVASVLEDLKLTFKSDSDSNERVDSSISLYRDNEICVALETAGKTKKASDVSIPKDSQDIGVFIGRYDTSGVEDTEALMDWCKDFDFDKLCDNLEKADIPSEWIDAIEEMESYMDFMSSDSMTAESY